MSISWRPILAIAGLLLLGACTAGQNAIVKSALATGVAGAREAKNNEAATLKAAVCATSIGANYRVNTAKERDALAVLCDPRYKARPLSPEELGRLDDIRAETAAPAPVEPAPATAP